MFELFTGLASIKTIISEVLGIQNTVYISVIVDIILITTLIYCITSVVLLAMKLLKIIKRVHSISEKVCMSFYMGAFLVSILFGIWMFSILKPTIEMMPLDQWIYGFFHNASTFITLLILFALVGGIGAAFIKYTIWFAKLYKDFLREEWNINGKMWGTVVGVYDSISGFYWGILVLLAFTFQLALVFLPIILSTVAMKAGQDD